MLLNGENISFVTDNQPPELETFQDMLQTFYGEDFVYQFLASDPEGSAILFTLESGPEGASLSPSGLLLWKAVSKNPHKLTFSLTDDCNAETKVEIEVINFIVKRHMLVRCLQYLITKSLVVHKKRKLSYWACLVGQGKIVWLPK